MKKLLFFGAILASILGCEYDEAATVDALLNKKNRVPSVDNETNLPPNAKIIDFEEYASGAIIEGIASCNGAVSIVGTNPRVNGVNAAMIFDSENPSPNDTDLGTPNDSFGGPGVSVDGPQVSNNTALGNVLIISEDLNSDQPNDAHVKGTKFEFDFTTTGGTVTLYKFDILDIEEEFSLGATVVNLYDASRNLILSKEIPFDQDNSKQVVDLEATSNVSYMEILMNNTGAIDNIAYSCDDPIIIDCPNLIALDFENLDQGAIVSELFTAYGLVTVDARNQANRKFNAAMVFDSSNPTPTDLDLGTPNEFYSGPGVSANGSALSNNTAAGNVLIISKDLNSMAPDDTSAVGSTFTFDFSGMGSVTLYSFDIFDIEENPEMAQPEIRLYDASGDVVFSTIVPFDTDNSKQIVDLEGTQGVVKMEIKINNSGAIDNIKLCPEGVKLGCDNQEDILDFEGFSNGATVSALSSNCGTRVTVNGVNTKFAGMNAAMIFDSANPSASDRDLGTPNAAYGGLGVSNDGTGVGNSRALGNVLIVSEDLNAAAPDDNYGKSTLTLTFETPTILNSFDLLDIDTTIFGDSFVKLYDVNGNELFSKKLMSKGDNSRQLIDLGRTPNVRRMEVQLNNSGAIDNIRFCCTTDGGGLS